MMITELIDQDDYCEWLQQAGVPVAGASSPAECSQAALGWLAVQDEEARRHFKLALSDFREKAAVMLPEVLEALQPLIDA